MHQLWQHVLVDRHFDVSSLKAWLCNQWCVSVQDLSPWPAFNSVLPFKTAVHCIMTQSGGIYVSHQDELLYPHKYNWTYNMKRDMDAKYLYEELNCLWCTHITLPFSNMERAGFSDLHYEACLWSSCREAFSQHVGHHNYSPSCHKWSKFNMLHISTWILFVWLI